MALFKNVVEAYIASRELDSASLSRLAFWTDALGDREVVHITTEHIDEALVKLAERGRLLGGKMPSSAAGKPLAGSTVNRYLTQAGSVFKHARRLKLVPRAFIPPTRGIERAPERPDPERYLRPEEIERLIAVARVMDTRWRKMPALVIGLCFALLRRWLRSLKLMQLPGVLPVESRVLGKRFECLRHLS